MISLNYKQQFMRNEALVKAHQALVVSEQFQVAVEMSLLQYQAELCLAQTQDQALGANAYQRLLGARQFVNILLNIAEAPKLTDKPKTTGLSYG